MFLDIPRSGEGFDEPWLPTLEAMIEVRRRTGLSTVVSGLLPEGIEPHLRERVQAHGVAALMGMAETIEALAGAALYAEARGALIESPPAALLTPGPDGPTRTLDEWESKECLARYGLASPPRS